MPFRGTNDLSTTPDVRIFFVGQLILQPLLESLGCEVFVNRSAADHYLSIEVRKKKSKKPDEIVLRHLGPLPFIPLDGDPQYGMTIGVIEKDPAVVNKAPELVNDDAVAVNAPSGALKNDPKALGLSVDAYNGANPSDEGEELALALNMERIHDVSPGQVQAFGGRPSILVKRGTFYTADTYPAGSILTKKKTGKPKTQPKFAAVIGANITLDGNEQLEIVWTPEGIPKQLLLDKLPNQTYEIYISNEPLFDEDDVQSNVKHDELAEFYKILPDIPPDEQFELTIPSDRGSLRTPCMSVLLNQ